MINLHFMIFLYLLIIFIALLAWAERKTLGPMQRRIGPIMIFLGLGLMA